MVDKNAATHGSGRSYTLLILAFVIAALYLAKEILLPLSLAILLSFVLTPLVSRLERLRLGRIPSVIIVCAIAFSAIGGAGWLATNQLIELSTRLPDYKDNLIDKIHNLQNGTGEKLEKAKQALEDIGTELSEGGDVADKEQDSAETSDQPALQKNILGWLNPQKQTDGSKDNPVEVKVVSLPPSPLNQIQTWLGPLVAPLSTAGIVVVLVVFILVKREDLRNRVIQLVGTSKLYATTEAIEDATDRLSRYLRMQLLINIIYGVVVAVTLMFLDVPNAILWGVMGTMLRFLPYIGPWISAAMPIALTMAISFILFRGAYGVLKDSIMILLEGVPPGFDLTEIKQTLKDQCRLVVDIHHVHAWSLTSNRPMLTLHAQITDSDQSVVAVKSIKAILKQEFQIDHSTIQIELEDCPDEEGSHSH